jgi:hypothetical protein
MVLIPDKGYGDGGEVPRKCAMIFEALAAMLLGTETGVSVAARGSISDREEQGVLPEIDFEVATIEKIKQSLFANGRFALQFCRPRGIGRAAGDC